MSKRKQKKMSVNNLVKAGFLLSAVAAVPQAQAATFGFGCISNNSATNCTTGESQLFVDVTDAGSNQVLFTFTNTGSGLSSIADVYFDDGTLLGIASIDNSSSGVSFSQGANPGNLPGGNLVGFTATSGFLADSDPPVQPNGVNPGEYLGITFDLLAGVTYMDTINALQSGTDLRIGIHVQGFADGGSESYVNTVPVPAAVWLFGSGLIGLVGVARRKKI
jgi:hypothetical protein